MGLFKNLDKYERGDIHEHMRNMKELIQSIVLKLDSDNNYDAENRKIKNVANPTNIVDVSNKKYVDDGLNTKPNTNDVVLKSGSTMSGDLDMNSNRISRVSTPRTGQYDAMNYKAFEDLFMKYDTHNANIKVQYPPNMQN